ncbi:protein msta isoform X2 [Eurytemora carolleeae]|uniref:protein msta isoform X1 n=1 Tax=Eurytemora carolleeae TaxID=1294199 RepID=UPI000C758277|nr:protein msta isoform X1 [Eurytemora carolleeae]XP_023328600.1 protein msta isoform X2 [Eurytemora carolleeae]|eukprot:XP_023328599.1 protein msta-like isoform X1 [Eurytemora affinis]
MVNKDENKSVEKETESKTEVKKENDIKPEKNGDEKVENEKNGEEKVENGKSEEGKVVNGKTEEPEKTYGDPSVCFLCGIPSTTKCKVCGLVGFCSDQHQRLHRDIEPLELIMWDGAAAMGPRMGGAPVCLQCLKPAKSDVRCGDCGWPVCGEECQKGHAHQIECPVLAKSKEKVVFENLSEVQDIYRSIVPLRLLMVKNKFPEVWERMSYLMDHNENRMKDAEMWGKYQTSVNQFLKNCGMEFSDEEIDRAVGLLWTNSFACAQGGGQAIFPSFSFASHSCRPNCAHSVFPNKTLALQAKIKIQAGEEFTISYISTLQGMLKRRTKLREKWFFDCSCSRCSDPTELGSHASTLLCQVCLSPDALLLSKDVLDPVAPWYCTKCDLQIRADEVNDIENRIATDMQKIETTSLAGFETMLETAGTELHHNPNLVIFLNKIYT